MNIIEIVDTLILRAEGKEDDFLIFSDKALLLNLKIKVRMVAKENEQLVNENRRLKMSSKVVYKEASCIEKDVVEKIIAILQLNDLID